MYSRCRFISLSLLIVPPGEQYRILHLRTTYDFNLFVFVDIAAREPYGDDQYADHRKDTIKGLSPKSQFSHF